MSKMSTIIPPKVQIKIKGQDGKELHFKAKGKTKWDKLMKIYCQHLCIVPGTIVFLHDGKGVNMHHTIDQLELEDGDEIIEIDAMLHQVSGGSWVDSIGSSGAPTTLW